MRVRQREEGREKRFKEGRKGADRREYGEREIERERERKREKERGLGEEIVK